MNSKLNYVLSCSGKYHYFDIAKVLYDRKQLTKIICGYPWFKLKKYGIKKEFVSSNGFIRILREPLISSKFYKKLDNFLNSLNSKNIDRIACNFINKNKDIDVLLGFAGVNLASGKLIREKKKIYICDSTSAHIQEQNNILAEEYKEHLNKKFEINKLNVETKLSEYENANIILVPSTFVKKTFEKFNFTKIKTLGLGSSVSNFFTLKEVKKSDTYFDILFIGQISLRKGLHYLIDAFNKFKHPKKRLHIIGSQTEDKDFFYSKLKNENIKLYGHMKHDKINNIINKCHVNVIPSIEDGFGLVVTEAAAAGCPSIVSENTGALDFINRNKCGLSVPVRDSNSLLEKLQLLADDKILLKQLSFNASIISKENTWENYVTKLDEIILDFKSKN